MKRRLYPMIAPVVLATACSQSQPSRTEPTRQRTGEPGSDLAAERPVKRAPASAARDGDPGQQTPDAGTDAGARTQPDPAARAAGGGLTADAAAPAAAPPPAPAPAIVQIIIAPPAAADTSTNAEPPRQRGWGSPAGRSGWGAHGIGGFPSQGTPGGNGFPNRR